MAIDVNEVYKTVLLIINKEQRGYITPDEFNKISTQVQLEIFEKYFEDLNQQLRVPLQAAQMDDDYANRVKSIEEKIQTFQVDHALTYDTDKFKLATDKPAIHRLGSLQYEVDNLSFTEIQRVTQHEWNLAQRSKLTSATESWPIYRQQGDLFYVSPSSIQANVKAYYIRKPYNTRWGYSIGSLGQYLYDSNTYIASGLPVINNYLINSVTTNFASTAPTFTPSETTFPDLTAATNGVTVNSTAGTGLTFNMTLTTDGVITNLTTTSAGSGYAVGDTITLDDSVFQQYSPAGTDAVITLNSSSLYSGTTYGSIQLDIDSIDQTEVVLNILKYCGIVIRDPQIIQSASQIAISEDNNEKS